MWNLKTTNLPVIVGALGMLKKETDKRINNIPDNPSLYDIHLQNCSSPLEGTIKVSKKYRPKEAAKKT